MYADRGVLTLRAPLAYSLWHIRQLLQGRKAIMGLKDFFFFFWLGSVALGERVHIKLCAAGDTP